MSWAKLIFLVCRIAHSGSLYYFFIIMIESTVLPKPDQTRTLIIVEHMEDYLFEWCLHNYLQMKKYLTGTSCDLAITDSKVIFDYSGQHVKQNK